MTEQQKPSKEYLLSLVAETQHIILEYGEIKAGRKQLSEDERRKWNERKDFVHAEIKRVRGLI